MIIVRDVFRLKFGRAKEAKTLAREAPVLDPNPGLAPMRVLFDLVGPHYTMVMETSFASLADFEAAMARVMGAPEFGGWYQKFTPLVESGYREIFTVLE